MSVVIPARDEDARLPACLAGLAGDPDVHEVIVVDDGSTDATARMARAHGARVVAGRESRSAACCAQPRRERAAGAR